MKRKNKRAEGLKNRINDHWLTATMATGMAGLATAAYVVSKSDDRPTGAAAPDDGPSLSDVGPLLQTVPDIVLPPENADRPAAALLPDAETAAETAAHLPAPAENAALIDWQAVLPQPAWPPVADLPEPPPPEPAAGDEGDGMTEEELAANGLAGVAAPSAQERADWQMLFQNPSVPQSRFGDLDVLFIGEGVSEERLLAEIVFGDPILDAAGLSMEAHELFALRNGNELWLRGGHDLSEGYFVRQIYLQFYAVADPSLFSSIVVYLQDDPDLNPGDATAENRPGNEPNLDPETPPPAPAVSPENQGPAGLFGDEAADFADTGFQYHQDPGIV